jgi:hypothetical protein
MSVAFAWWTAGAWWYGLVWWWTGGSVLARRVGGIWSPAKCSRQNPLHQSEPSNFTDRLHAPPNLPSVPSLFRSRALPTSFHSTALALSWDCVTERERKLHASLARLHSKVALAAVGRRRRYHTLVPRLPFRPRIVSMVVVAVVSTARARRLYS